MDNILRDIPDLFDTERLTLRCPRPGDGAIYHQAVSESIAELRQWLPWAEPAPSPEECEAKMRHAQAAYLQRTDLWYLIFLKDTGALVGGTGLHYPEWSVPSFEIGYWAHTAYAGRGLSPKPSWVCATLLLVF